ncbi:phage integrase family protein [Paraburkholderia nodosa]|uniref:phage integrase family protein n=1 Tax=Paraburkholderia nodosa TaxID=392320 RepID=UPI000841B32D|nr:phage integrase family protein [Paraburkholderia nodosa]
MQTRSPNISLTRFPSDAELAALRSRYEGVGAREAVSRYLDHQRVTDASARSALGRVRRRLAAYARERNRPDLAAAFLEQPAQGGSPSISRAIETLRRLPLPLPALADPVSMWLPPRIVTALMAHGLHTIADLVVRIRFRHRWWEPVRGLGAAGASHIEAFLAAHSDLGERAYAALAASPLAPWETLRVPEALNGTRGQFRAPQTACLLNATNDYEAVQSWLSLHDTPGTHRAYRKEVERLMLWAIIERGRALSSLTTDDAIAFRGFLRRPTPLARWTGPARPRHSAEWRPFVSALSPRSTAYALTVLSAMYRWLVEQRYVFANPFAGVRVRRRTRAADLDASHSFTASEWQTVRMIADALEWSYGWSLPAAQRLRFLLDFGYATGLRASELVDARLDDICTDERGDHWLHVNGKGEKAGKAGLPPLARRALTHYLLQRDLPVTPERWTPGTPIVAGLDNKGAPIASLRLWRILRRFFLLAAHVVEADRPALAGKLRQASPHWLRHTHASHALAHGAELVTVRDNLRHASIATTSIYLHGDDIRRARQLDEAFGTP